MPNQEIDDLHWTRDAWEFDIVFNHKGKWNIYVCGSLVEEDWDNRDEAEAWIKARGDGGLIELISRAEF